MRIGILGGSFNPVHRGHLALADFAFSELNLDHLYFVPSFQSPLKAQKDLLPAEIRVRLLKKALKSRPDFSVLTCEIDRGGKSYTVDTLRYLRRKKGPGAVFYFLTGMDSLKDLPKWKSVDELFKLCRFVVASRPGHRWENTRFPVLPMSFPALDVSSTQIRSRLKSKAGVEDLIPDGIASDVRKIFAKHRTLHPRGVKKGIKKGRKKEV